MLIIVETACVFAFCDCRIDATAEDANFGLGRLVNDEHINPNARMRKRIVNSIPRLCLFASRDIGQGEEVRYSYGPGHYTWRQVFHFTYIS